MYRRIYADISWWWHKIFPSYCFIFSFLERHNEWIFFSLYQISFVLCSLHECIKLKLLNLFIVSIIIDTEWLFFCFSLSVIKHTALSSETPSRFLSCRFQMKVSSNPNLIPLTAIVAEKDIKLITWFSLPVICLNGFSWPTAFSFIYSQKKKHLLL